MQSSLESRTECAERTCGNRRESCSSENGQPDGGGERPIPHRARRPDRLDDLLHLAPHVRVLWLRLAGAQVVEAAALREPGGEEGRGGMARARAREGRGGAGRGGWVCRLVMHELFIGRCTISSTVSITPSSRHSSAGHSCSRSVHTTVLAVWKKPTCQMGSSSEPGRRRARAGGWGGNGARTISLMMSVCMCSMSGSLLRSAPNAPTTEPDCTGKARK